MSEQDRASRSPAEIELARKLVRRMTRLLDVSQVIKTGARATFRMPRFDLTVDFELGLVRSHNKLVFVIWENCSQPLCALVDPETLEISQLLGLDSNKIVNEVLPALIRSTVLDELADISST